MIIIHYIMGSFLTWLAIVTKQTVVVDGTAHPFKYHPELGHWRLEILPDWHLFNWYFMRGYQNLRDGIRGDKRGWYTNKFGKSTGAKVWWNGIRNPLNTQKRLYNAFDIAKCKTWVREGYLEHVDEDSESTWGEKWVYAQDLETGEVYESRESMKPLVILGWETGYCVRRMQGYKFDVGEENIPFPDPDTPMTYDYYKEQCIQYAKDGYHQGEAMINLDRNAPETGRRWWMFTLKKIN